MIRLLGSAERPEICRNRRRGGECGGGCNGHATTAEKFKGGRRVKVRRMGYPAQDHALSCERGYRQAAGKRDERGRDMRLCLLCDGAMARGPECV